MIPGARRATAAALLTLFSLFLLPGLPAEAEPLAPARDPSAPGEGDQASSGLFAHHTRDWATIAAGLVLTGGSFLLANQADDAYDAYLKGSDPATLAHQYDRAVHYDRWASATLLVGQAAVALGLYWRLVRHPHVQTHAERPGEGSDARAAPESGSSSLRWILDPATARIGVALSF